MRIAPSVQYLTNFTKLTAAILFLKRGDILSPISEIACYAFQLVLLAQALCIVAHLDRGSLGQHQKLVVPSQRLTSTGAHKLMPPPHASSTQVTLGMLVWYLHIEVHIHQASQHSSIYSRKFRIFSNYTPYLYMIYSNYTRHSQISEIIANNTKTLQFIVIRLILWKGHILLLAKIFSLQS